MGVWFEEDVVVARFFFFLSVHSVVASQVVCVAGCGVQFSDGLSSNDVVFFCFADGGSFARRVAKMLKKIFKVDDPKGIRPAKVVEDDLQGYEAVGWNHCFDSSQDISVSGSDTFRVYIGGSIENARFVWILLHGAGQSALVWSLLASELKTVGHAVVAFDARGHGDSHHADEKDLSRDRLAQDCVEIVDRVVPKGKKICLVGHSMGGSIALAAAAMIGRHGGVMGLVVMDVVEGTAMASLATIRKFVNSRPTSFSSGDFWKSLFPLLTEKKKFLKLCVGCWILARCVLWTALDSASQPN
jgi:pimeloyl-ACP methyl ester carboxylesterase